MLAWRTAVLALAALVLLATCIAVRLFLVVLSTHNRPRPPRPTDEASLAVFLGGHTAEMMRLVAHLDWTRFPTRTWIISRGDTLSEHRALELERTIASGQFRILRIPRARKVHQSILTSPFTTLYSLASCVWHIALAPLLLLPTATSPSASSSPPTSPDSSGGQRRQRSRTFADVVLLNGPGSCVPITLAAFLPRLLALPSPPPRLIYLESLARTRRLSLSARLVRPFVDRFFVQWEALREELLAREGEGEGDRVGEASGEGRGREREREWETKRWRLTARVECRGWLV
ncbi:hypothetical protein JCM9279_003677 [Rhodotorula babjevae]